MSGCVELAEGNRERAEGLWREVAELATRTHVATVRLFPPHSAAILAIVDGRLEDALELLRQYVECADALGASGRGQFFSLLTLFTPLLHLGHTEAWLKLLDEYSLAGRAYERSLTGTVLRGICLAHAGRPAEGQALVAPLLDQVETARDGDETPLDHLAALLQAANLFEHRAAAASLLHRLVSVAHLSMADWAFPTSVARQLGDAAALLGDRSAARVYYAQGLASARKINFRPEIALTRLRLAELLLAEVAGAGRSQALRHEALRHLEIAISEMREMNMVPGLERALALRDEHARVDAAVSDTLTPRERDIVSLIAAGLTNREIAERLVVSRGTVEVHVKHILSKLHFTSRKQVAAWVTNGHAKVAIELSSNCRRRSVIG
jgi:RNA polymerase sigma factor (sigma-70 family)